MTEAAEKLWSQSQPQAQTEKSSVGIARLALGVDSITSSALCGSHCCGVQPQPPPKVQTLIRHEEPCPGKDEARPASPPPSPRDLGRVVTSQSL